MGCVFVNSLGENFYVIGPAIMDDLHTWDVKCSFIIQKSKNIFSTQEGTILIFFACITMGLCHWDFCLNDTSLIALNHSMF